MMDLLYHVSDIIDRPLRIGLKLNQYTIESVLGMGSYGISYAVSDDVGREYVVKQLRTSKRWSKYGRDSFQYEKKILQALHHPSIPKLVDDFKWRRNLFLVMERMPGLTFEELIFDQHKTYCERDVFHIIHNILCIVMYIHKHNIVHRDLRIPNILYDNHSFSIIDFGLARYIGEKDERIQTFHYEKLRMRDIQFYSDFYALGHFALFLLYSGYESTKDPERPWYEELVMSTKGRYILERMLQIAEPYESVEEVMMDILTIVKE